jgi:glycosyltransferase involved in cell wall biosynthesis
MSGSWTPPIIDARQIEPVPGRILHVVGQSLPHTLAGFTVRTHHTVRAQLEAGIDAGVVTRHRFPWDIGLTPEASLEAYDGVPYHRLGGRGRQQPLDRHLKAGIKAATGLVETLRPALLHAHSDFRNGLIALALRDVYGIPVVYEARGFWEETWLSGGPHRTTESNAYRWRRAREIEVMQRADHVVTLAETMVDRIVGDGIPPEKVTIVPNAIDPAAFPSTERDRTVARRHGIADDEPIVGYISSLSKYEGIETLIKATATLRRAGSRVRCLIVGDGDARERLERVAARQDVAEAVVFTGRVPHTDVAGYYAALDVFVVPRRDERVSRLLQPLKPFEALASGLPLVVSDLPALRLIVDRSGAGRSFTPDDPESLASVLGELLDDEGLRAELGRRGSDHVQAHHTWTANAERYRQIYGALGAL